jgi:hypothetical protein
VAVLALGLVPYLSLRVLIPARSKLVFMVVVLLIYSSGIGALIAARNGWPRVERRKLLLGGALACYLSAAFWLAVVAVDATVPHRQSFDAALIALGLILALIAGAMAVGLTRALRSGAQPA